MGPAAASPLRLVIGFSPNSASYNVARVLVPGLAAALGRPVDLVLEPGESGAIAARLVAASPPDGETLLIATLGTHAIVPAINPGCGYHPLSGFTPIALLLSAPLVLAVPVASEMASVAALIDRARNADAPLAYGTSAIGGAPHLAAALFAHRAGVALRHARYTDTRDLYFDLIAGRIALSFNNVMSMLPRIRERRLTALGTTGTRPHPSLPDVPPIALAAGLPDYEVTNWVGLVGPAGLPADRVAAMNAAVAAAVSGLASAVPSDMLASSPEAFASMLDSECRRWAPIVRQLGWTAR